MPQRVLFSLVFGLLAGLWGMYALASPAMSLQPAHSHHADEPDRASISHGSEDEPGECPAPGECLTCHVGPHCKSGARDSAPIPQLALAVGDPPASDGYSFRAALEVEVDLGPPDRARLQVWRT